MNKIIACEGFPMQISYNITLIENFIIKPFLRQKTETLKRIVEPDIQHHTENHKVRSSSSQRIPSYSHMA